MAVAITIDIIEGDRVFVRHIFYGSTESEARKRMEWHLDACRQLSDAEDDNLIGEFVEKIPNDEVPCADDYDLSDKEIDLEAQDEEGDEDQEDLSGDEADEENE